MVYCCYLLVSENPKFPNHTYIGFTTNPLRRIRQHNGEISMGAHKTHRKRPWKMVMVIYGFPTQCAALRFEWAWQHPGDSKYVRDVARTCLKGLGVPWLLPAKARVAREMLNLPQWSRMPLSVRTVDEYIAERLGGQEALPSNITLSIGPLAELFSNVSMLDEREDDSSKGFDSEGGLKFCCLCGTCFEEGDSIARCPSTPDCPLQAHLVCVADALLGESPQLIPTQGSCPECGANVIWKDILKTSSQVKSQSPFLPASQCLK